jgi:hypothetical protein
LPATGQYFNRETYPERMETAVGCPEFQWMVAGI